MEKKYKLIYWILTILMFVPGVIGGVVEVFTDGPESIDLAQQYRTHD